MLLRRRNAIKPAVEIKLTVPNVAFSVGFNVLKMALGFML
jgi:hypothetical protein